MAAIASSSSFSFEVWLVPGSSLVCALDDAAAAGCGGGVEIGCCGTLLLLPGIFGLSSTLGNRSNGGLLDLEVWAVEPRPLGCCGLVMALYNLDPRAAMLAMNEYA